ncbi:hypothetical protein NM688_g4858 [Phlebia brevispora]|uniref:Uncharacterized protein n=1 Tax=Phlebia brevispora TaxID=194682 RepID=A0ACC1T201_9APHY|nr:hypothetical protein NM688_g4858 [Phlebia brevispora]
MTSTPSTSLHVLPPTQADIKPFPENPPTPLTPRSTINSAISSRAQLSEESTYPPATKPSLLLDHPSRRSLSDMPDEYLQDKPAAFIYDGSLGQEGKGGSDQSQTTQMSMLGLKCAPPDVLPPSPPLTVADPRDESGADEDLHAASSSFAEQQGVSSAPPRMREEDITEWRASMHKGDEDDDEVGDLDGPMDEEYDPYDLGYSSEATPATPVGPSARTGGPFMGSDEKLTTQKRLREAADHPLRLDVHPPPSPPPWEVIQPPEVSVTLPSQVKDHTQNSLTSRPLIPHSAYYFGPPPIDAAYGTDPIGYIGVHHPREIIRIERDYSGGETVQFAASYPLELEGRITPTQFLETINAINERLIEAHSLKHSLVDNALSFFTLQLSRFVMPSHYEKEMRRLHQVINELNTQLYNPAGLNILWPRDVAFMFLEIEYY